MLTFHSTTSCCTTCRSYLDHKLLWRCFNLPTDVRERPNHSHR